MIKTMKKGDELMEFLARYVRKVHSDWYIKKALEQDPGTSFLDIICPSDIAYVICLLVNSMEIWIDALDNKNKDGNKQGKKEKRKPRFTAGEGKKRVFGECSGTRTGRMPTHMHYVIGRRHSTQKNQSTRCCVMGGNSGC